jgi:hypothetical protein
MMWLKSLISDIIAVIMLFLVLVSVGVIGLIIIGPSA